jgi:hypothetical protein
LLEYREEQHSQPPWTDRTVPFLSRRETVLASGFVEAVGETPPGVDGVQDPDRPEGTTDVPAVQSVEPQLTCGRLRLLGLSYSEAVVYWFLHNRPANLDLNGTGIPCDNTFDGQSIDAFWPQLPLLPGDELESGLFCRDLDARSYAYPNVVAYWFREGKPDRMDADRNGIPCEALYDPIEIESFFGDPAPTTTTTTITTTWYAVGDPHSGPGTLSGSGGAGGSGCSPGTSALPDGAWFVIIEAATPDHITFDLACTWPGKELDEGHITNDSDRMRTIEVASGATAYQVIDAGGLDWVPMAYTEWLVAPSDPNLCSHPCDAAWLYVNDGAVTELVQLFFP